MRKWCVLRVVPAALALITSLHATRASAIALPFVGTFTVEIIGVVSTTLAGAGTATVNGSGPGGALSSLSLPAGVFATAGFQADLTTGVFPIAGVKLTFANGAGAFARTGMGSLRGPMPTVGVAKVCLFAACGSAFANLSVPLSVVGGGGAAAATGLANLTVKGAPWTTGTVYMSLPFAPYLTARKGTAHGPASMTGSTAAAGGMLQLVTPIVVSTNIGVDQPSVFGWVTTTLHFVPEPGTLVLAASGLALLAAGARRIRV